LQAHRKTIPFCGTENGSVPAVRASTIIRQKVIVLLNRFDETDIREAIKLLTVTENDQYVRCVQIIFGDDLHAEGAPCKLFNRACNDGMTLWVSVRMLHDLTAEEIGYSLPLNVRPWTFVLLHEFAHILMKHSLLEGVPTSAKETRADCWAVRYITF
jgi:hypothetical protein